MPFATTQMKLEGIELSELNQRKTNVIRSHLCVKSKKLKTVDWWVPEAGNVKVVVGKILTWLSRFPPASTPQCKYPA